MKKEGRNTYLLTVIGVALLLVAVIGLTFAYFTASITNNVTNISVTTTQVANLTMTSMKSEVSDPIYPGWVGYQAIDVTATGSGTAIYDLTLEVTGGTNIKNDVNIEVCKMENTTALEASQITFTAATPVVNTTTNPAQYYMTGGSVSFPSGCTTVVSSMSLTTFGASKVISADLGKEIASGNHDRYYIKLTYVNNPSSAQVQGETFTITPTIAAKAEQDTIPIITCENTADSGTYEACDTSSMYIGERVKIGNDANAQYFRYIRTTTTDTLVQLNECGTGTSEPYTVSCADSATSTVGIPSPSGATGPVMRLLAEYNLNVGIYQYNGAATGLQHEYVKGSVDNNDINSYNGGLFYGTIAFGSSVQYSTSNVKTYVEQYASSLSTTYAISGLSGSALTKAELLNLCSLSTFGVCASTHPWVHQTSYWTGSASTDRRVYSIYYSTSYSSGFVDENMRNNSDSNGVRPVIQVPISLFS